MPRYDYRCTKCGTSFSRVEPMAEHGDRRPACPTCRSRSVTRVLVAFFAKTARKS